MINYIKKNEETYDEAYMEKEEREIKLAHDKYDNRIKAYVSMLDSIIKENNIELLERFAISFNQLISEDLQDYPQSVICIYWFLEAYLDAKNRGMQKDMLCSIASYENYVNIMLEIRFMVWRVLYLNDTLQMLIEYVKDNKISIYILKKAVMVACVDEAEGSKLVKDILDL